MLGSLLVRELSLGVTTRFKFLSVTGPCRRRRWFEVLPACLPNCSMKSPSDVDSAAIPHHSTNSQEQQHTDLTICKSLKMARHCLPLLALSLLLCISSLWPAVAAAEGECKVDAVSLSTTPPPPKTPHTTHPISSPHNRRPTHRPACTRQRAHSNRHQATAAGAGNRRR